MKGRQDLGRAPIPRLVLGLAVPALTAVVFLGAFAVAWVISKIPLAGRYLT